MTQNGAETQHDTAIARKSAALDRLLDEAAIRQLSVNYALVTDAIGRGELGAGRAHYRRIFTPNAEVRDGGSPPAIGPDAWADFVHQALSRNSATQHLIGTIAVVFDEPADGRARSGTMTTYLHATHEYAPGGDVFIYLGTYLDAVVRTDEGWRIARRTLVTTSTELRRAPRV